MLAASCLPYCQYLSVSKFNLSFLQTSLLSTLHLLSFSITSAKHSLKSKQPLNAQCQCKMSPQNHFLFHQCLRITETVQSEALKIQTYPPSFVDFMLCMLAPDTGIIFQSQLELYTFQLSGRRCWYLPIVCLSSPVIYFAQVWPKCN